jgi:spermidine/putrescine transport system substrate-binding protein
VTKKRTSTEETVLAAKRFNRRAVLKSTVAGLSVAATGPWYTADAQSSSGSLSIINWDDELPDPVIPNFEKATGIKVSLTPFSQNEEQINKLQATKGAGWDLCMPTHDRAPQFKDIGVLAPLDESKLSLGGLIPSLLEPARKDWTEGGKMLWVPHCWGTEAISWRNDQTKIAPADLSYGTLWKDEYKGKVQGRPHSLLLGIGLFMDGAGTLKTNRMLDAFKSEADMKRIYDVILKEAVTRKPWIKQFWDSADNTKSGYMTNGCVIGQTWDGPAISLKKTGAPVSYQAPKEGAIGWIIGQTWDGPAISIKKQGQPITYMAPQEGAIGWIDGMSLTKAAKNVPQAYEFLKYIHSAKGSAEVAEGSGYNPGNKDSQPLLSEKFRAIFNEAYPGDSLKQIWWRPVEPSWFADLRTQYAEKFKTA